MEHAHHDLGLSPKDIDLAHESVDLMASDVLAAEDIAQGVEASVEDVRRVLSYMSRWTRTSFFTQRGRKSKICPRLFE